MWSINSKMDVLRIIDTLNTNTNVKTVGIRVSSNKWNSKIVTLITNRYTIVYCYEYEYGLYLNGYDQHLY